MASNKTGWEKHVRYSPAGGNPVPYEEHFKSDVDMSQVSRIREVPEWKLPEKYRRGNWQTMEDLSNCHPYPTTGYNDNYLSYEDGW